MRYLVLGLIVGLLVMRLLRTRWAGTLLGISRRALEVAQLILLAVTVAIALAAEEWVLLAVAGALLIWAIVDLVRGRRAGRGAERTAGGSTRPRGAPEKSRRR